MGKIYRTMQGKEIDMDQLRSKNETMPAVGNVRVNARGDELGPDGKIIKTREEILSEYYDTDPKLVSDEEISLTKVKIESPRKKINKLEEQIQPVKPNKIKEAKWQSEEK